MKNRILSFSEFNSLYESFGFMNESNEPVKPDFTPEDLSMSDDDLSLLIGESLDEDESINQFAIIKMGEKSPRVTQLQKDLGIKSDGIFGEKTLAAVKKFQADNKITVDGKVGVQTLRKMLELKGVKDTKKQDDAIKKVYIKIETQDQAKGAGLDPAVIDIFESIWLVKNGDQTYVIAIPKKDSAKMFEDLRKSGKFSGLEFLYEGVKAIGKAIVYTATGFAIITIEMASALIQGIGSACKFVGSKIAFAMGATLQGIIQAAKWAKAVGQKAYKPLANFLSSSMETLAVWAGKSIEAMTAFYSVLQAIGYTLTGIAITAWQKMKGVLAPAVKAIVETSKDAAAYVKSGMDAIAKKGAEAVTKFKNTVKQGYESMKSFTIEAYNKAKATAQKLGKNVQSSIQSAYDNTLGLFSDMYQKGKEFWESFAFESGDPIFEALAWE